MALINNYANALAAGNVLLCLPPELRQECFAYAALNHIREHLPHASIEAADIRSGRQCTWLPPLCHVNDDLFLECLPMFLWHVNIVIRESSTAYNLQYFLASTQTFAHICALCFTQPDTFVSLSAGSDLLQRCHNLRYVRMTFRLSSLKIPWGTKNSQTPEALLDRKKFAESHSVRELLKLRYIRKVSIMIHCDTWTFSDRGISVVTLSGTDDFWGFAPWLEQKFRRRGVPVKVVCQLRYEGS